MISLEQSLQASRIGQSQKGLPMNCCMCLRDTTLDSGGAQEGLFNGLFHLGPTMWRLAPELQGWPGRASECEKLLGREHRCMSWLAQHFCLQGGA